MHSSDCHYIRIRSHRDKSLFLQSLVNSVAREGVVGADEGLENGYA